MLSVVINSSEIVRMSSPQCRRLSLCRDSEDEFATVETPFPLSVYVERITDKINNFLVFVDLPQSLAPPLVDVKIGAIEIVVDNWVRQPNPQTWSRPESVLDEPQKSSQWPESMSAKLGCCTSLW
ncbi:trafficking protein particle complex subunit 11 [Striga asiatica]|uniref:Trafficking protein particle complex subunit 11 n=1 Tax=Striga asiatica TaxID=4170 RepID=A0A5A7QU34_STRAF|nr:trafficking protein particle complex subunit 11 [Striga asiatica]